MYKLLHKPLAWQNLARRLRRLSRTSALAGGLMLAGSLYSSSAWAQNVSDNYDFAASSGTYVPLDATATEITSMKADGNLSAATPIGFTFNFNGTDYTQFRASSDGYMSFGTSTSNTLTNDLATTTASRKPLIAPLWDDLDGRATGGSKASYKLTGTPGSQVLTFEWSKWEWDYSATTPVISFQIKLYEGSNKIELIYNPESGSVSSGSASVGIAGTGSNNYLSLNNLSANARVSATTETTSINAKPAAGQTYTFTRISSLAVDAAATALVSPGTTGCYGPNQTVTVTIKNMGTYPLNFSATPVTVNAAATGTNPVTFPAVVVNTGTLAPGATQDVIVSTTYDMSAAGTYTFNAAAAATGDARMYNNAMPAVTRTLNPVVALAQEVDFTGFTGSNLTTVFPNWKESEGANRTSPTTSDWTSSTSLGGSGNVTARTNLFGTGKTEWIIGPKIVPTATTQVTFKTAVTNWNSSAADADGMAGTDDKVQVMVSTDCGVTFTPIFTIDSTFNLTNTLVQQSVSLANYAGQTIMVAFYATDGPIDDDADYDFHIDDIFIGTPPTIDFGATAMAGPGTAGCYSANEPVSITIKNFLSTTHNFVTDPVTVTVNVTGATTQTLTTTVNTGTLAGGATLDVVVGNLDMSGAGTYTFNATTTATGEGRPVNDAMPAATRTVSPVVALPQEVDFTGFTGSNLTTVFPNWKESEGANRTSPTTSDWTSSTGLGGSGNKTAKVNLYTTSGTEWIIGPKVTPTATTVLSFKAAVTGYNSLAADSDGGMNDTDDKVQVMVSTDCGLTFTPIFAIDSSFHLTNTLVQQSVSLANYAGQTIMVAFYATDGPVNDDPDYDFHIDDIFIGTPPAYDLAATGLAAPATAQACFGTENISLTIQNLGPDTLNFSLTPATVTVNVSGIATQALTTTLNTGKLAPNATQDVALGTLNMSAPGTYTFNGFASLGNDGNRNNDTIAAVNILNSMISALPHLQNFENASTGAPGTFPAGWQMTSPGGSFRWQVNSGSTSSSATGPNVDHTLGTSSGKYVYTEASNGVTGSTTYLTSPCINLTGLANPGMEFWYHMAGAGMGTLEVEISSDNGATWTNLTTFAGPQQTSESSPWLRKLVSFAGYTGNVSVRFKGILGPQAGSTAAIYEGDMAVDDVKILDLPAIDLELTALALPATGCGLTATEDVCISIKNNGIAAATNFPVSYTINGGTAVTETVTLSVAPGATVQYCFTTKADFSAANTYNVVASAALTGDTTSANNTATGSVASIPTVATFPYTQDFENGNGGWTASGANSSWALGTPTGTVINAAASGTNAWVTNLSGTYNNYENSTVTSPCFNLSSLSNPAISLKIWWDTEDDYDGAALQSSIDGGATWQLVGAFNDPDFWYNNDDISADPGNQQIGWSGEGTAGSGGWVLAKHALTGLGGQTSVKFRIAFASDVSYSYDGFGFDDVTIYEIPAVPTITAGGATTFCSGGSVVLTAASTTTGVTYQWFNNGTAITGATAATYTATTAGSYTVTANLGTNASAASAATAVTVNTTPATPTVTVTGGSTTICQGSSVTLTGATTTTGVTYQWSLNGAPIAGATSATYDATQAGAYRVIALNGTCADSSVVTTITVNPKPATPTITNTNNTLSTPAVTGATYQWYSVSGTTLTPLAGETAATFTPTVSGDYTVRITQNGCESDAAATITVTITGIGSLAAGMDVSVYPNPTAGMFAVQLKGFEKEATIQIINVTGQVITTEKVNITSNVTSKAFNLNGMAKGVYILKVTSGDNLTFRKVILD